LSLCYQTSVGAISVEIIEARGLKAMDINGFSGQSRAYTNADAIITSAKQVIGLFYPTFSVS